MRRTWFALPAAAVLVTLAACAAEPARDQAAPSAAASPAATPGSSDPSLPAISSPSSASAQASPDVSAPADLQQVTPAQRKLLDSIIDSRLGEPDAVEVLRLQGYSSRVVERNGEPYMVTMDYSSARANLVIDSGKVVDGYWG